MSDKFFLDTNVFVYAIDSSPEERSKQDTARRLVQNAVREALGVISIQVLQEFYQVSTRKIRVSLSPDEALEFMRYMAILEIVQPDLAMIEAAVFLEQRYLLSFWDALILQTARAAGCSRVFSEDLQPGLCIDDMTVVSPFAA